VQTSRLPRCGAAHAPHSKRAAAPGLLELEARRRGLARDRLRPVAALVSQRQSADTNWFSRLVRYQQTGSARSMQPDPAPHALPAYSIRPDSCRGLTSASGLGPQAIAQGKFLDQLARFAVRLASCLGPRCGAILSQPGAGSQSARTTQVCLFLSRFAQQLDETVLWSKSLRTIPGVWIRAWWGLHRREIRVAHVKKRPIFSVSYLIFKFRVELVT
jgi:hypothetical protein